MFRVAETHDGLGTRGRLGTSRSNASCNDLYLNHNAVLRVKISRAFTMGVVPCMCLCLETTSCDDSYLLLATTVAQWLILDAVRF